MRQKDTKIQENLVKFSRFLIENQTKKKKAEDKKVAEEKMIKDKEEEIQKKEELLR